MERKVPSELLADARIIAGLMPREQHTSRVAASVEHAARHGLERVDTNAEQRIGAHLLRLDRLLARGEVVRQRVWESAIGELVVRREDIPESYWHQQYQLARDNDMPMW